MKYKLGFETLEQRLVLSGSDLLSDYIDVGQLALEPAYTTFDAPANHVTPTNSQFNGVVELTIQTNQGTFLGTGTLLPTGRHILTAAHNVTNVGPNPVPTITNLAATFELPSGDVSINVDLAHIDVHPNWNRNLTVGNDIAILELVSDAPAAARRFDIYRNTAEILATGEKAGYGQSGQGVVTIGAGAKRDGQNLYEFFLDGTADILLYDFDNGVAANDTFGLVAGRNNLGLGNDEVMTAPGDSGGPTLIDGQIAGVTSFRTTAAGGTGDSVAGLNSSFGEIGGDTRVSVFAPWIDAVIDVPGLPQIDNVMISGSTSTHAPFSFDTVDGSGLQLRTVPVGGADTVSVRFNEHVINISDSSLSINNLLNGAVPALATNGFSYDVGTHTATWRFSAPLALGQYLISLTDTVTDVGDNQLDGEWTNPFSVTTTNSAVSEFPSGNGTAGGDFNFAFTIMPGDADLSNDVSGLDFLIYQMNTGGPGHTFGQADFNGDGYTDSSDLAIWEANSAELTDLLFADFDGDGIVDGDDLDIWETYFGIGSTHAEGDADGDGQVDGVDFQFWQRQVGLRLNWVA